MNRHLINFFYEDTPEQPPLISTLNWLKTNTINLTSKSFELNFILCSDPYILEVNKTYLHHDYFTDIITFNNSEDEGLLEADIFISVDTVADNASELGIDYEKELARVLIHGVLHLSGYNDKTDEEQQMMTAMEDKYLALHPEF